MLWLPFNLFIKFESESFLEHWQFPFLLLPFSIFLLPSPAVQAYSGYISGSSLQTPLWSCLFFWLLRLWLPSLEHEPVGIPQSLISKCLYFCWCFTRLWPRLLKLDCHWRLFQAITMWPGAPNPPECRTMVRKCGWVDLSLFMNFTAKDKKAKSSTCYLQCPAAAVSSLKVGRGSQKSQGRHLCNAALQPVFQA